MHFFKILILSFITIPVALFSQTDTLKSKKKTHVFTVQMDVIGIKDFKVCSQEKYNGEYYNYFLDEWEWKKTSFANCTYLNRHKFKSIKFDLLLSVYKNFNLGISYQGIILPPLIPRWQQQGPEYTERVAFFAISGIADYSYYIKPVKNLFTFASLSIGTYQGNDEGIGKELFGELRGGIGYTVKKRFNLKLWAANDRLYYYEKNVSPIFNKEQTHTKTWNIYHSGFGIAYKFFLKTE